MPAQSAVSTAVIPEFLSLPVNALLPFRLNLADISTTQKETPPRRDFAGILRQRRISGGNSRAGGGAPERESSLRMSAGSRSSREDIPRKN
jgi:hypothetical protein